MHGVDTRSVHVGFLGSKVALVPVFLQVVLIYPVGIIPPMLHVDTKSVHVGVLGSKVALVPVFL